MSTLRRNIRYYRQERNLPPNPLPHEYQVTANGDQFLSRRGAAVKGVEHISTNL